MNNKVTKRKIKRRRGVVQGVIRVIIAVYLFIYDIVMDDIKIIVRNTRLFAGIAFTTIGVFSFESSKYCDGNTSNYYACTRPSTYYYYSWWAIFLIVIGLFSIVLWFVRNKRKR